MGCKFICMHVSCVCVYVYLQSFSLLTIPEFGVSVVSKYV